MSGQVYLNEYHFHKGIAS